MIEDLGPAERFAAGAIGEPGARRFYLQVRTGTRTVSMLAEKEQVAALAEEGVSVLDAHGISSDETVVDALVAAGLPIDDPGETGARFRVGRVSIGMAPSELLTVTIESTEDDDGVSFVIAPEQFRAMARVALDVVAAGRPTCQWCRLPLDPSGHECPARNGGSRP